MAKFNVIFPILDKREFDTLGEFEVFKFEGKNRLYQCVAIGKNEILYKTYEVPFTPKMYRKKKGSSSIIEIVDLLYLYYRYIVPNSVNL